MKLYYGTYGHHLSGKLYVYWGDDNLRTGEQVVAPVTNKNTGKTYDTMFTIARAQNEKNAQGEVDRLMGQGIFIKTIGGRGTLSLPGGKDFDTKAAWKRDSDARYRKKYGLQEPEPKLKKTSSNDSKSERPSSGKSAKDALGALAKTKRGMKDTATEKAKSALLSNKKTVADSSKQKESITKMKQRDAFKE